LPCERPHLLSFLASGIRRESRGNYHELITTHTCNVVVFTTGIFECLGKKPQHAIALEMAEAIVDLLESIHVRDHHRQR
jgi:hypothetical protein